MTSPEEKRRRRLSQLASKIQNESKGLHALDRLYGWGMLAWGCKKNTMDEYLEALMLGGLIHVDKKAGEVRWAESG